MGLLTVKPCVQRQIRIDRQYCGGETSTSTVTYSPAMLLDWIKQGYAIEEVVQPSRGPFEIAAGNTVVVPNPRYEYRAIYGAIVAFSGTFNDPNCGIRVEYGLPGGQVHDTGVVYTVLNYMVGSSKYDPSVYVHVPPDTPPGLYLIKRISGWSWVDWCRLSLFNADSTDHWCLGYGYHLVMAKGPKVTK